MILKAFPDLNELKKKAEKAFPESPVTGSGKHGANNWPLVILNTQTSFCHRPDIKGPFSIFSNVTGSSRVSAGSRNVVVCEDSFFITNRAQHYTLEIDNPAGTEIFNLHLGQNLWEDFIYSQTTTLPTLLDNPFEGQPAPGLAEFPNLLQLKNPDIQKSLQTLQQLAKAGPVTVLQLEENLGPLFLGLANQKAEIARSVAGLPLKKSSLKAEIFKRISLATDVMLSGPDEKLTLDDLAKVACMSKFHFLRAFQQVHQATPHQFLQVLRLRKSCRLLQQTQLSVAEIGLHCGYPDQAVFSRTFRRATGYSPQQYRKFL